MTSLPKQRKKTKKKENRLPGWAVALEVLVAGADYRPRRREITSLFCFQQQHLHAASAAAHLQRKRPTATKTSQLDRARPSNLNTNSVFRARGASVARCLNLCLVELRYKQLKIWQRWPIFAEPTTVRRGSANIRALKSDPEARTRLAGWSWSRSP